MPTQLTAEQIDTLFREGNQANEIAKQVNTNPTGLYPYLLSRHGVAVATLRFLVDSKTGRPLKRAFLDDALAAGIKATKRRNKTSDQIG